MLSKSDYLRYLQCKKCLWLYKHRKDLKPKPSASQEAIFEQGYKVENYARELFPKGVEIENVFSDGDKKTKELIANGKKVIYQASVMAEGLWAMADIFIKNEDKWDIYEVKSSTEVKDEHIADLCFQKIAFEKGGFKIGDTYLVHINNEYVKNVEIEPNKLLTIEKITEQVDNLRSSVEADIPKAIKITKETEEPTVRILKQCKKPYECPFKEYCFRDIPPYSIYNLTRINERKLADLLDMGIMEICDIPDGFPLSTAQENQILTAKSGKPIIEIGKTATTLKSLPYPLYFLDYESIAPAIPIYDGTKPYQQVCFQYSLHVVTENGTEHYEYLGKGDKNPIPDLLKSMRGNIGDTGAVIVWNKSFESSRNNEMAEMYPEYKDFLASVNGRIFDLMEIFSKQYYVHPEFKGRYSIKKVLPVIVPELSYKNLEIQKGDIASLKWFGIARGEITGAEKDTIFKNLLKYCHLDTLAMVEIWNNILKIQKV
ncbi:MAG: hypothetical protein ACD_51C00365G0002 [uncultured bacterium]|nr:MAG: hypothetical protein ACD_51C00365G0002 [uncultured bacterium]